ncbi:hypothetical protein JX265_013910 [Neoarthrinium moseri]|uniref:Alkaline phosphatase D n=1 Tax=Neoarthrinium moseri TaxID=1658444 RepID=A0A9P9W7U5_9PEZI|nr:uncharacterized protein JN550_013290 [Neoarthrinium moseri]KAI1847868.1 hypothetical protein JX265_013910 [Neoarthrinium moseri]KAI1857310.1 hypothetical protein JN550_013290 [Neoarthrinium moseri]
MWSRGMSAVGGSLYLASLAVASFDGNLNYNSPSRRHSNLGIDVTLVNRRSFKRGAIPWSPEQLNFTHGVASGDPYPDSVVLWTRVAPGMESDTSNVTVEGTAPLYNTDRDPYIEADPNPVCVEWKVFETQASTSSTCSWSWPFCLVNPDCSSCCKPFSTCSATATNAHGRVVSSGTAYTTSDIDYTIEATSLQPFTTYNYQFTICGSDRVSPLGRTKTAPRAEDDLAQVKFAIFSCSNFPLGYFNAYGNAARKDEHDYVIHLGDYIYESAGAGQRAHKPEKYVFSLPEYRTRHGQYRTDPDLLLNAQNFAWIPTWDDHEVANNVYRDGMSALFNTENSFLKNGASISVDQRKMNAVRAYWEWMPIRQVDLDDNLRIWRSFQMGKLLDLIMLDTRNYDRSITDLGNTFTEYIDLIKDDGGRSLMGSHQEHWFYRQLSESAKRGATWRIIGNQVIFSRLEFSQGLGLDTWSGYASNRNRTLKHLYDNNIHNNIFLAGDSHQSWVSDLAWRGDKPYDENTGLGAIGVEFAGTAVTSPGGEVGSIATLEAQSQVDVDANPELQWAEGYYRGYFILTVTPAEVNAQFYGSPSVATRNPWDLSLANFTVVVNDNHLARPVAGGSVEAGHVQGGEVNPTNVTLNTETGEWDIVGYETMYLSIK